MTQRIIGVIVTVALCVLRPALAQVDLRSMTYRSDGLQVKGYLAEPKRGDRLPCLIFNRGGNRAFGGHR
jgi:hypothetical protein